MLDDLAPLLIKKKKKPPKDQNGMAERPTPYIGRQINYHFGIQSTSRNTNFKGKEEEVRVRKSSC